MDCSPPGSSVHGISQARNTGVGCCFLPQGIFLTQGLNPHFLHWQVDSLWQSDWEALNEHILYVVNTYRTVLQVLVGQVALEGVISIYMKLSQYSCLENPMDGGAWWATVHGVAKSWTWLRDFTFSLSPDKISTAETTIQSHVTPMPRLKNKRSWSQIILILILFDPVMFPWKNYLTSVFSSVKSTQ